MNALTNIGESDEPRMKTLHIHVTSFVSAKKLHQYDTEIAGVYAAEVDEGLCEGLSAWGALEAFHEKIGIKRLDDFSIAVFDPETLKYIKQIEPEDDQDVVYSYYGKLADKVPKAARRRK